MIWLAVALGLILVVALLYWLFIIAEGAYMGSGAVILLYNWGAKSYDRIKDLDPVDEARYLARPILDEIQAVPQPLVLDVATGTGRLPLALLRQLDFRGHIVGLDLSAQMLAQARRKIVWFGDHVDLIRRGADILPFRDEAFDLVTCLEALEFLPAPRVIAEMVRVLRPGGLLLVSNRVGWESYFLPARFCGRGRMERLLATHSLQDIRAEQWQAYYDLVWARKESRGRV